MPKLAFMQKVYLINKNSAPPLYLGYGPIYRLNYEHPYC